MAIGYFIAGLITGKLLSGSKTEERCNHKWELDIDYCEQNHPYLVNHTCYKCIHCNAHKMV